MAKFYSSLPPSIYIVIVSFLQTGERMDISNENNINVPFDNSQKQNKKTLLAVIRDNFQWFMYIESKDISNL